MGAFEPRHCYIVYEIKTNTLQVKKITKTLQVLKIIIKTLLFYRKNNFF
jgi:hypothetical protein